jgi:class 3 adenylate cyclase
LRRLKAVDVALLCTLTAAWGVAFALHLQQVVSGRLAWVPVLVSAPGPGERYPSVRGFWSGNEAARHTFAVGDSLRRAGTADLAGVGPIGFVARVQSEAAADLSVPIGLERDGVAGEATLALAPVGQPWRIAPLVIAMALTGVLVLLRVPRAPVGRAFFLGAITYAIHWSLFQGGSAVQTYVWAAVFALTAAVMLPYCLRPALLFPQDIAPRDGRLPYWPWLFALFSPLATSWVFGVPFSHEVGQRGALTINVAFVATYLVLLTRNYLRSGPVGRRQLAWVVYGFYVGMVPIFAADAIAAFRPSLWWLHEVATICLIAVPACLLIAISRSHLFDIDRLISLTAVYTSLSLLLLAAVFTVIPTLAAAASATIGTEPGTIQLGLSVLLAGGFVLGGPYLRARTERVFFPERHRLATGFEQLLLRLSACASPVELLTLAGESLTALLRPDLCRIYVAAEGGGHALLFSTEARPLPSAPAPPTVSALPGPPADASVSPAIAADAPALTPLLGLQAPLEVSAQERRQTTLLPPGARALLESLGVAVVVPVTRAGRAAALIVLGAKRSGDVYTTTDMALLRGVADKLSTELLRFDEAETLRQERAVQAALSQYVPDPLVALLARGQEVEGGEREVSVLFVDLRSFTTFSERHRTDTVLSIVNRYTQEASGIISRHGGTVVEFLGDGLMAVFGAPEPLPAQSRAAVSCAREIVTAVRDLELAGPGESPIAVGIGITTGTAFVGNVRASDRLIYTAIGDVVNLASRLEGLTRSLDAAVAIDAATHAAAGGAAAPFRRHGPALVKGRDQAVEVYYLPLEEGGRTT